MTKYRYQLSMRSVRRFFYSLVGIRIVPEVSDLTYIVESVNSMYSVDLSTPQHGHKEAQVKQALVVYLDEAKLFKSDTQMTIALWDVGVAKKGFSRRNVTHMLNTAGNEMTDSLVFNEFRDSINASL
tara:strand:- start:3189 stop:3569 length:381 start_codon:yes stop_codon:yes gene_type:complete